MELNRMLCLLCLHFLVFVSNAQTDFYSHSVANTDGDLISLEKYRGKVTLVVNVASECGFTEKHYKGLVKAKNILSKNDKFEILAFPCNQFGAQEPKSAQEVLDFAKSVYSVNFPIFAKINVIEHDVPKAWEYLIEKSGNAPNWNFWKYLIDPNGAVLGSWGPWSDVEEIFPTVKSAVDAAVQKDGRGPQMPSRQAQPPQPSKPSNGQMPSPSVRPPPPVNIRAPESRPPPPAKHDDL